METMINGEGFYTVELSSLSGDIEFVLSGDEDHD